MSVARCVWNLQPYWATIHNFCLEFSQDVLLSADLFTMRVRSWVDTLERRNFKYLRDAIVTFGGPGRPGSETYQGMRLRFWSDGSLYLEICLSFPTDATLLAPEASSHILSPPIGGIEADRQILSLEGEAIVVAPTTLASTWVKVYTEWLRTPKGGKCE